MNTDIEKVAGTEQLPRSIAPGRDLWPDIESGLTPRHAANGARRAGWKSPALAASVAVAFVAGLLLGREVAPPAPEPVSSLPYSIMMQAALEASEREYRAAFREFIPVNTAGPELGTGVVDSIERSWAELEQAESALRAALHEYPENIYLNRKLLDLRSQQLGFMKQMAMLDQFSRRKI
ncbi:MAG: hypothetical protein HKN58_06425 [Xanthomonadales bacterium]|nr:hypothetical protein [Xanthomonadales bacterium]